MSLKNKKHFLSLKVKIVLIMNTMVLLLAGLLTYINIDLIIKDKQAYIYDSILSSSKNAKVLVERLLISKKSYSNLIIKNFKVDLNQIYEQLEADEDLFQFGVITKKGNRYKSNVLYANQKVYQRYLRDTSYLANVENEFKDILVFSNPNEPVIKLHFHSNSVAPRLYIVYKAKTANKYIFFDYVLDNVFTDFFSHKNLDVIISQGKRNIVYHNFPVDAKSSFYEKLFSATEDVSVGSVKEIGQKEDSYIFSKQKVELQDDLMILAGIDGHKAFDVTNFLILQTLVYILFCIGFMTLIALFFSRALTRPLSLLMASIERITGGDYKNKVEIKSGDEFEELGESFNFMLAKINEYHATILDYSQSLELKVEERTQEIKQKNIQIKSMVDNVDQGFMVFNKDGIVGDLFTKASEKIFGVDPHRQKLHKILKSDLKEKDFLDNWFSSLFSEMIPFESIKELGVKEKKYGDDLNSSDFKYVELDYFPLRNEKKEIENIVIVAVDSTKEYRSRMESKKQADFINSTVKVIKDKNKFVEVVEMFKSQLNVAMTEKWEKGEALKLLHSIKGVISIYGFVLLTDSLHHAEDELVKCESNAEANNLVQSTLSRTLTEFESHTQQVLSYVNEISAGVEASDEGIQAEEIYSIINNLDYSELVPKIQEQLSYRCPSSLLASYHGLVDELSVKLGKKIAPISYETNGVRIPSSRYQPFINSCVHIFRNIVDHAIEHPSERKFAGKREQGEISITTYENESEFVLSIEDDGRGINPDVVRSKMEKLNYPKERIQKADEDVIYHIFDEEFSTSDEVSDVSGRGVGLSDVKQQAEKIGGQVYLETALGKGTVFLFKFPN